MKKNNIKIEMSDKGRFAWQYFIMTIIAFAMIFVVVVIVMAICSTPKVEATIKENKDISFVEQDEEVSIQPMIMNVSTKSESKNIVDNNIAEIQTEYKNLGEFRLTAYCSCSKCCEKYANNRPVDKDGNEIVYTASGKIAKSEYTVAADPSVLPYGTIVYINGHRYEVQDCGGAIKGNRIDIYFDSHEAALEFGVQYADVFI